MKNDVGRKAIALHRKYHGKIEVCPKIRLTKKSLPLVYTPGVAAVSRAINIKPEDARELTIKRNSVAVITDGSKVLGLGALGPLASLPVMEGKALLFKALANVDAFPICLNTQDPKEIIKIIRNIAPVFGAINLEDIAAPNCFEVEDGLQDLGIPVMHDDQHATAIVVQAALINAAKVAGKELTELKVVINGAGAAGIACAKALRNIRTKDSHVSVEDIIVCDSGGVLHRDRPGMNRYKAVVAAETNKHDRTGALKDAMKGTDVFVGLSVEKAVTKEMIKTMNEGPIIFAMANPHPEIMPRDALDAGAVIVGTGSSDFPNQVNNVLAFPGVFRGALDARAATITEEMKLSAAYALARSVRPKANKILPHPLDGKYVKNIALAVKKAAKRSEA